MYERNRLEEIKNFILRNKKILAAYILSGLAIISIIFLFSVLNKDSKNITASKGEIPSKSETTTDDSSANSLKETTTQNNSNDETSSLSDMDFTLPEDATEEPETTLAASSYKYLIKVNRVLNCVTIYTKDSSGEYTVPYKAMACSTGKVLSNTPLGTFKTSNKYTWRLMVDNTQSQYATRVYGGILFHSVPCYKAQKDQLEYEEFNKLGSAASLGCIRLTVADSKWIYDNCPSGTTVIIYDDDTSPGPLGKPQVIKIPSDSPYRGWDPTDPDPSNPWNNCSPSITASDMTIKAGTSVNIASTFKATDTCGNDISSSILMTGNFNKDVPGAYQITLSVTDLLGRSASKTITITVEASTTQKPAASSGQLKN